MDGLLVIDKPPGPTSHDVVARMRKTLGEDRVGHTGTLDPAASGLLPLAVGRATRLARFLSAADKGYEATVRLGIATDTYDGEGVPVGAPHAGPFPEGQVIASALETFRGTFLQQPPLYSAKKIRGRPSHRLARRSARRCQSGAPAEPVLPTPTTVTVKYLQIVTVEGALVTLQVECSAGFYVRALAHELGLRLGTGAHLVALRRVRSGDLTLADAVPLASIESDRGAALAALVPLAAMLPSIEPLQLTEQGADRAVHGRDLGPSDFLIEPSTASEPGPAGRGTRRWYRLLDPSGALVGVAEEGAFGLLHPSIVLV